MDDILQFNRTYRLVIGKPNSGKGIEIIGDEKNNQGLQISFDVKKHVDNKEKSNDASITLYNLSEDTINYIQQDNLAVFLFVGYSGNNKLLFQGITQEIDTDDRMRGSDRKTTIKCVPADSLVYSPSISKTFPANTTPRQIINYLISQSTTLSRASFNSKNVDERFPFGYPVSGTPKQILNELARDFNFTYNIDGKRLYVADVNRYQSPNSVERAFVISPSTGLVGVPSFASADGKKTKDDTTRKSGVKFTALCNALIKPGSAVSIKDTTINGIFRVNSAEYKGSWRDSNTWYVECWCSKLSGREV